MIWRDYVICLRFLWRKHGFMETVWKLSGGFMEKTLQIKLPDKLHIHFTIKSP